ncbi:MAG: ribonuclease HII [Clostridiales bacterium]|nr:ribonuclease HII [Clostridiales bacterium]
MDWKIENEYFDQGIKIICGTDEAGRGPLCGPVVAGACILPAGVDIPYLNDSKKLTEKRREALYDIITEVAISWAVAEATPEEIDSLNILNASQLAMRRAIAKLSPTPEIALVDGNVARDFTLPTRTLVGGDGLSPSIAAASVLAKVTRDHILVTLDAEYPTLRLAKHKGYPTKAHYAALNEYIDEYGEAPDIYRRSFLKKLHRT